MISNIETAPIAIDDTQAQQIFDSSGRAQVLGITGPPGSGKSTLVDQLIQYVRADNLSTAVLAVDPSSPLTGGAVLGDRVRMSRHATDPGVFIRSMGTRGANRALASATRDAVRILDAAGWDLIIVETVGVGQIELDVGALTDIVAVVAVPGLGDSIQMNKAGILEIGDTFVVNMADRPETTRFVRDLKHSLALGTPRELRPVVCTTIATTGEGIPELWSELRNQHRRIADSGFLEQRRNAHLKQELRDLVQERVSTRVNDWLEQSHQLNRLTNLTAQRTCTPRSAADQLSNELLPPQGSNPGTGSTTTSSIAT